MRLEKENYKSLSPNLATAQTIVAILVFIEVLVCVINLYIFFPNAIFGTLQQLLKTGMPYIPMLNL